MREILFRGKRKDNGQWIEGNLLFYPDTNRAYITIGDYFKGQCCEVIRGTVGQFTGETDRNGKKIFEGDIWRHYTQTEVVRFEKCGFAPFAISGWECTPDPEWGTVIGNIHDNPEKLEG